MAEHLQEFTPERWSTVKAVLAGEHGDKVSMTAAAKAAGVTLATVRAWIRRSENKHPEDDPLIHEIAPFMREVGQYQADALEDVMWGRAVNGWEEPVYYKGELVDTKTKFDNKLLMRLMEVRDERYRPRSTHVNLNLSDKSEIYARLLAGHRIASAEDERKKITLDQTEYREVETPTIPTEYVQATPVDDDGELDLSL